jgi:hypothetical protein
MFHLGSTELIIIPAIVTLLFWAGRIGEIAGGIGLGDQSFPCGNPRAAMPFYIMYIHNRSD